MILDRESCFIYIVTHNKNLGLIYIMLTGFDFI